MLQAGGVGCLTRQRNRRGSWSKTFFVLFCASHGSQDGRDLASTRTDIERPSAGMRLFLSYGPNKITHSRSITLFFMCLNCQGNADFFVLEKFPSPKAPPKWRDDDELRNYNPPTPAAHAVPLASAHQSPENQKKKPKTRPAIRPFAIRRSARWRATLQGRLQGNAS